MNFRTLVRSISPFVKKKDKRSDSIDSKQEDDEEQPPISSTYTWDLANIDLTVALKHFYKEHNPEKVNTIEYILGQYVGEEILMLQTLCERYNVDEEDMQYYLDKGKSKKKDRKKSVGGESKSVRETSNASDKGPNYSEFSWKLSHCDVGASLKQLYKDHNPLKTPNIALLNEKTNEETINLLQQLCKRHQLTEEDMQGYLDMFNKKKNRNSVVNTPANPVVPAASSAPVAARRASSEILSTPETKVPFSTSKSENYTTLATSPLPDSRYQPPPAAAASNDSDNGSFSPAPPPSKVTPPPPSVQRVPSNSSTAPPPPPPGSSPAISRPPPPSGGSGSVPPMSKSMTQTSLFQNVSPVTSVKNENIHPSNPGNNNNDDTVSVQSGMSKVSMNHMRPVLAGGKRFSMGPVLREISSIRLSGGDAAANVGTMETLTEERGTELELEKMRAELELARKQMLDVSKESQEVIKLLKDNAETINTNLNSAAITAINLAAQQQEAIELDRKEKELQKKEQIEQKRKAAQARAVEAAAEKKKMDEMPKIIEALQQEKKSNIERIKMLEDLERQLRAKCDTLQQKHDEMKEQWSTNKQDLQDALEDKEDLLQLISVMHSSPIAVKNILESFLNKLGQTTGSMSVMLGVSPEGTSLSISERISAALQIKRNQGRELSNVLSPKDQSTVKSGDNNSSSRAPTPTTTTNTTASAGSLNQSTAEGARINKMSEEEFKLYQQIHQQNNVNAGVNTSSRSNSNNRQGSESPSMRSLQRSATTSATAPTSPKSADQLLSDQYELAKRYFDNQKANSRIAHQMEESNLALQEIKTEQIISKTLDSNKKMSSLSKSQLADDWIECYDPRTKRTYFHSPSLKKSTWTKPSTNSTIVANSVDKSLHPTLLQMQQGGKVAPNGLSVFTSGDDYLGGGGGSSPPSRYNSPSLAMGFGNAASQLDTAYYGINEPFSSLATPSHTSNYNIELQRNLSLLSNNNNNNNNRSSSVEDELQMHSTLNDIVNRNKSTTQQSQQQPITQQQLYQFQQQMMQMQGMSIPQQQQPFRSYNNAPMSTDELISHNSFDIGNFPLPSNTPSIVTDNHDSLAEIRTNVSNSSRPSSASRARPPPNNGGRTSRSASPQLPTKGQMNSSKQPSSVWVMAVDPKSQRKYWYNRETKVSTWRMPVELMN